ncbi:MAG: hypothetical protein H0T69_03770 [Thermoleophilaceae bacterium]|nr:hypothetical protein [Thermoleophilaceae bacterium]
MAKPDATDKRVAIAQCKAERGKTKATHQAFKAKYHSFSRCIRQNAAEEHAEQRAARQNAAKQCKAERSDPDFASTHDGKTFEEFYGTNKNGRNAYGKCVSGNARELKAAEDAQDAQEVQAFKNAAKECAAERSDENFAAGHDGKTFEQFYGTNKNKRNAFGKCVSSKSQESYTDPMDP